jgi:hypothetical protein
MEEAQRISEGRYGVAMKISRIYPYIINHRTEVAGVATFKINHESTPQAPR